jgi:hypothetical protein
LPIFKNLEWASDQVALKGVQNARRIIGQRQGRIDRLEQALKNGAVLPNGGKYSKG